LVALAGNAKPASAQSADYNNSGSLEPPGPERSYVFIIDQNLCDGCRACTIGCQTEMQVPPAWGGQLSYAGKQAWIEVFDQGNGVYLPVPCQNCQDAPCAKVCPVGATFYDENHINLIDQNRCIGCRYCVVACPYERRFFNWFNPPVPPEDANIPYSPDYNIPHRGGVAEKCIWCVHRVAQDVIPACVEACYTAGMKALWFGDQNQGVVTDGHDVEEISVLTNFRAPYKLNEDLGTMPSVLYLPPKGSPT